MHYLHRKMPYAEMNVLRPSVRPSVVCDYYQRLNLLSEFQEARYSS